MSKIDHGPFEDDDRLAPADPLAKAIGAWHDEAPQRDLWPGIAARIGRGSRRVSFTWSQLALAASLVIAASAGVTWLVARQSVAAPGVPERVVRAEAEAIDAPSMSVTPANFADAQFDAAVADLERVLRVERARLDPRTVIVIERNLRTIDQAIAEARSALAQDTANTYLNSHLADARRRKLDLLRRATALAPTGGN